MVWEQRVHVIVMITNLVEREEEPPVSSLLSDTEMFSRISYCCLKARCSTGQNVFGLSTPAATKQKSSLPYILKEPLHTVLFLNEKKIINFLQANFRR
jgi:hypothetical protein